jgi:hypothetical protein
MFGFERSDLIHHSEAARFCAPSPRSFATTVTYAVLWVVPTNSRAIALYESEGWRADGATHVQDVLGAIVEEARFRRQL